MSVSGGSVRKFFHNFETYIGVDWRAGPCVDVVCMAMDMNFPEQFDVVISASMLEHDPTWKESLAAMVRHLKPNGILLLSWGAALNCEHCNDTAPDGKFHSLKAGLALAELEKLGIYIHEFHYEGNLPYVPANKLTPRGRGMGEVCLVGFWSREIAPRKVKRHIDRLLKVDQE